MGKTAALNTVSRWPKFFLPLGIKEKMDIVMASNGFKGGRGVVGGKIVYENDLGATTMWAASQRVSEGNLIASPERVKWEVNWRIYHARRLISLSRADVN